MRLIPFQFFVDDSHGEIFQVNGFILLITKVVTPMRKQNRNCAINCRKINYVFDTARWPKCFKAPFNTKQLIKVFPFYLMHFSFSC